MNSQILLVSTDLTVAREVEAIVNFLEYELILIKGVADLRLDSNPGDFIMALLHLPEPEDMQAAIDILTDQGKSGALYALDTKDTLGRSRSLPPALHGFIDYPIKYRNLLATIREVEMATPQNEDDVIERNGLTGVSPGLRQTQALAAQVAGTEAIVLLLGESGTGKGVLARSIHQLSSRADKPFISVNCGAIPPDLLESELFGHEKGAFTGAVSARRGRFELAAGGTLFLDEIGDMPMAMQVKLLRVLQERTFERVGGSKSISSTARIIAATHQQLEEHVEQGKFRLDLYYRLNVFPISLLPLRERVEDIPHLVNEFTGRLESRQQLPARLDPTAVQAICQHPLLGNVRELENLIERLSILYPGESVSAMQLPQNYQLASALNGPFVSIPDVVSVPGADSDLHNDEIVEPRQPMYVADTGIPSSGVDLKAHLVSIEKSLLLESLAKSDWVVTRAAKLLGLRRTTLVEKMRKFKLSKTAG